jgi:NADH dehydrogenase
MRVVIIGGGFAGLNLVKHLAGENGFEVILVDKNNYHFFPPLLYQVATSFIEPSNITYPFRKMFQKKANVRFHQGSLQRINSESKYIETDTGVVSYDILVLAFGAETNYFSMENVKKYSLPMKSIDDALNMRNRILLNLEKASRTLDELEREKLLTIVIAGGGPTGVEIAGMLAEMGRKVIEKDYPEFKDNMGKIYLIDMLPTMLSTMSAKAQREATETLSELGVRIKLGVGVKDYNNDTVLLSNGEKIISSTLVWASGVAVKNIPGIPESSLAKANRIKVDEYNQVIGTFDIYAIGDSCFQTNDKNYPNGYPQLAQVAIQQGKNLGKNLVNYVKHKEKVPFHYFNKGSMAIISKYKAVVDLPVGFYKGFFAWLTWLFIHIIPIAGFRNKLKLVYNWLWSFITNDPTLRIIIRPEDRV